MTDKRNLFLATAAIGAVLAFSLTAIVPAIGQAGDEILNMTNSTDTTQINASTIDFIADNGTLDCAAVASELGGIAVPNGDVCDVVVVRQAPTVTGHNNITMNQFTLMNSVLEFLPVLNDTTGMRDVYVMGDFALLETEMNPVLQVVTANNWTVTGVHNHMINETPKMSFMHWEVHGEIGAIIENANEAFAATSIKGETPVVDNPGANTTSAVAFSEEMRELWVDHIVYTRQFIVDSAGDLPSLNQTTERLLENQEDMGDAIKPYYGQEAGDELTDLLKDHILIAAELVNAAKDGNQSGVQAANTTWFQNADEIASFLAGANPDWDEDSLRDMLYDHLNLTTTEAVSRLDGDYAADIEAFDEVHRQAMDMADMLSMGIIGQFPESFG